MHLPIPGNFKWIFMIKAGKTGQVQGFWEISSAEELCIWILYLFLKHQHSANWFPGQTMIVFTNYHWIKVISFNVTVLYYPFSDLVGFTLESFTKLFSVEWFCLIFFPIWIFCMPFAFIKTIQNFSGPNRFFFWLLFTVNWHLHNNVGH